MLEYQGCYIIGLLFFINGGVEKEDGFWSKAVFYIGGTIWMISGFCKQVFVS